MIVVGQMCAVVRARFATTRLTDRRLTDVGRRSSPKKNGGKTAIIELLIIKWAAFLSSSLSTFQTRSKSTIHVNDRLIQARTGKQLNPFFSNLSHLQGPNTPWRSSPSPRTRRQRTIVEGRTPSQAPRR